MIRKIRRPFIILLTFFLFFSTAIQAEENITDQVAGIDLIQNGSFKEGLTILEEYTRNNSTNPEVWNSIGYALNNLGRFRDAISPLEEATRLDPNHTIAWTNMGWA